LEDPGDFGGSFEFSELVFVDLGSDGLQKLLLFPTLVFNFLFDKFDKFLAVGGVGCNDLELSGLFLGKRFRGGGDALGEGGDFFENSVLKSPGLRWRSAAARCVSARFRSSCAFPARPPLRFLAKGWVTVLLLLLAEVFELLLVSAELLVELVGDCFEDGNLLFQLANECLAFLVGVLELGQLLEELFGLLFFVAGFAILGETYMWEFTRDFIANC
jgi:hypothetical protein